jgi:hypothetical protein
MEYFVAAFCVLNTLLLIGIAGSVAKIILFIKGESDTKEEWAQAIRQKQLANTSSRIPNYTDTERPPNWDGIPKNPNWDGINKSIN